MKSKVLDKKQDTASVRGTRKHTNLVNEWDRGEAREEGRERKRMDGTRVGGGRDIGEFIRNRKEREYKIERIDHSEIVSSVLRIVGKMRKWENK